MGHVLRREWGLSPLCWAVVTFSHYSKRPNSPMQLVVVMAVRAAVMAATMMRRIVYKSLDFFIVVSF